MPIEGQLPDMREDEPQPRLFSTVTGLAANSALIGSVYFGGSLIAKKYGTTPFSKDHFQGYIDKWLVKWKVMKPRNNQIGKDMGSVVPLSADAIRAGSPYMGPLRPATGVSPIFNVNSRAEDAEYWRRRAHDIKRTYDDINELLMDRSPITKKSKYSLEQKNRMRVALYEVITQRQRDILDPTANPILRSIDANKILSGGIGSSEQVERVLELLQPDTVQWPTEAPLSTRDAALKFNARPGMFEILLAQDIHQAKRRYVDNAPHQLGETTILPLPEQDALDSVHHIMESATQRRELSDIALQQTLWETHGPLQGRTGGALDALDQVLTARIPNIDEPMPLSGALKLQNAGNKKAVMDIARSWANADGVVSISLDSIQDVGGGHHVATLRAVVALGDGTGTVSHLIPVPLLDKYGRFRPGIGQNDRAGAIFVPEHATATEITRSGYPVVSVREGGTHKSDFYTPVTYLAKQHAAQAHNIARELSDGNKAGAVRFTRDLLNKSHLQSAQLLIGENIWSAFYGSRVIFDATQALQSTGAKSKIKTRLDAMEQYDRFLSARSSGRDTVYLDIETVSPYPTDHPYKKIFDKNTEVYQISAIRKDAAGNWVDGKTWWIRSEAKVNLEWARQTINEADRNNPDAVMTRRNWIQKQISQGVTIEQAVNELKRDILRKGGRAPLVITQFGVGSDIPTLERVAKQLKIDLGSEFNEVFDTYTVGKAANRSIDQSFTLEKLAQHFGITPDNVRDKLRAEAGNMEVISSGSRPRLNELGDIDRYLDQHSAPFDALMTNLLAERMMTDESYVHRVLGNQKQREFYTAIMGGGFNPELIVPMLNADAMFDAMDINWDNALFRTLASSGHPKSMMARGMKNMEEILDFIPFGGLGVKLPRGIHKRLNTARITDMSVRNMMDMDVQMGLERGSSMHPHFVTQRMLQFISDPNARANYLSHFFNVNIAFANTPFATQSQVLVGERLSHLASEYNQRNYPVQIPGAVKAFVVARAKNPVNPASINRRERAEGKTITIHPNQYIIIQYEDSKGNVEYISEQYKGNHRAIIDTRLADFDPVTHTLYLDQRIQREAVTGSGLQVGGVNTTMTPTTMRMTRSGMPRNQNAVDVLMNWDDGFTKYHEHGKYAEAIFGKIFDPLIEATRAGGRTGNWAARRQLQNMLGILNEELPRKVFSLVETNNLNANKKMTQIRLATMNQEEQTRLLRQGLNWNTITELYKELNQFSKANPSAIPSHYKYGDPQEVADAKAEMKRWQSKLKAELRSAIKVEATARDYAQIRKLQLDLLGLRRLTAQMDVGQYKFLEHVILGEGKSPMKTIGFITRGPAGLGIQDPVTTSFIAPFSNPFPETYDGRPSAGLKMRVQSIQLFDNAMEAAGMSIDSRNRIREAFTHRLARSQAPAVALDLRDLEFTLAGLDPALYGDMRIRNMTFEQVRADVTKIRESMSRVARASTGYTVRYRNFDDNRIYAATIGASDISGNTDTERAASARSKVRAAIPVGSDILELTPQPMPGTEELAHAVYPDVFKDTFLSSQDPIIVQMEGLSPKQMSALNLNFDELQKELIEAGVPEYKAIQLASELRTGWTMGKNEVRLPALGKFFPGRPIRGMAAMSEMQIKAFNIFDALSFRGNEEQQHYQGVTDSVTTFYHALTQHFGRHRLTGEASTAYLPGLRGSLQPMMAAPMFTSGSEKITSKYNALNTTVITKSDAAAMGLGGFLTKAVGQTEASAIMEGSVPIMNIAMREPYNFPTSGLVVQTYVLDDDMVVDRKIATRTHQVGGPGQVVVRITNEATKNMLMGDSDRDDLVMMVLGDSENFGAIQKDLRTLYKKQITSFMEHHHYRMEQWTVKGGVSDVGNELFFRRGWDEAGENVGFVQITEPEAIRSARGSNVMTDNAMAHMLSSKRVDMASRLKDDSRVISLLDSMTGRITAATWHLRAIEEALLSDPNASGEFIEQLKAARRGDAWGPLVTYRKNPDGSPVLENGKPVQIPVGPGVTLVNDAEELMSHKLFAQALGEIIQETTIAKGKSPQEAEEGIRIILQALHPKTESGARLHLLQTFAEMFRGSIGDNHIRHVDRMITAFDALPNNVADTHRTFEKALISSQDPMALQTWAFLREAGEQHALDPGVAAQLLFGTREMSHEMKQLQSDILAAEWMRGIGEPKYFGRRSLSSYISEMIGIDEPSARRGLRYGAIGAGAIGAATFFMPNQTEWFLGGPSVGTGGEKYDYFGDKRGLPSSVPLDTPQYVWDEPFHAYEKNSLTDRRQVAAEMERIAQGAVTSLQRSWERPRGADIQVEYRSFRRKPSFNTVRNGQNSLKDHRR